MSNGHNRTVFCVLRKKISTGWEKLAPIDWQDWHVLATLPIRSENLLPPEGQSENGRESENPVLLIKVAWLVFHLRVIVPDWLRLITNLSTNALFTMKPISMLQIFSSTVLIRNGTNFKGFDKQACKNFLFF